MEENINKRPKERKTNNHSARKSYSTKKMTPYEIYRNMQSWRATPISGAFLEKFCQEMIDWSSRKDSFCLTQFLRYWGVNEKYFYEWLSKYPDVQDAYWFAMSSMGDKREIGALTRKYDAGTAEKVMAGYSSIWAAVESRRAKMRREEQGDSFDDLANCVRGLVEEKCGNEKVINEVESGTDSEAGEIPS